MAIRGPLRELGIHDVFQLLDLGRKTGTLRVMSELRQNEGTIWVEQGAVVAAVVRSNPHPLGEVLLRAGKIAEEDLVRAAAMQRDGDPRRLGEILVAIGALTRQELEQQVRAQVEEVVFSVLGWSEGYFEFEEGAPRDAPREAAIRIGIGALLMEGARRIDEWTRLQARIPHLGVIPHLASGDAAEPGSLQLTPFEWRVLAACDGRLDVRGVARSLGASDFDTARALFGLAAAGIVWLHDPAAATAERVAGRDPVTALAEAEEFLRQGDPAAARMVAQAVAAAWPEEARAHLVIGRARLAELCYREAEAALRDALRVDPTLAPALRLLGQARVRLGLLEEALHAWERWLALPARPRDEERHAVEVSRCVEAVRMLTDGLGPAP
jgi:hypothetical protein